MTSSVRFRRTITLIKGLVYLNIGKKGISVSIGKPGCRLTIGKVTRLTLGIPGTGVSKTWVPRGTYR